MDDYTQYETIVNTLRENPEPLIQFAATELANLGSRPEWSLDDNFSVSEGLVRLASTTYGLPSAGDQSDIELAFYRAAAESIGLDVPDDDNEPMTLWRQQ